jgi:DNA mismatch repair ATPase MutS
MSSHQLKGIYEQRRNNFEAELNDVSKRINLISNLRLAAAALFLILLYFSFTNSLYGLGVLASVIVFFGLVKKHALLFERKSHLTNLVRINWDELRSLEMDFVYRDAGNEFIDGHHAYTHDLDIFGEGSLYQYINRCHTYQGRKKLAEHLSQPLQDAATILEQQQAMKELSSRIDLRQNMEAAAMETGEQKQDHNQLLLWTKQPAMFRNMELIRWVLIVVPVITVAALLATFFFSWAKMILLPGIITQWMITGTMLKKINVYHDYISRKKNILEKYSTFLRFVAAEKFTATTTEVLSANAREAHLEVTQLASLVRALDARTNSIATLIVNSLLLYDLQCVFRLERWRTTNSLRLPVWLHTITEMEVLNSFSTYAWNNPSFAFATVTSHLRIEGKALAHPLILENERVVNDVSLGPEPSVLIVTGANMAGKSTFLRTLGVNVVLALNGAPVCAAEFFCPVIHLRSGMRTADSLKDHQSYFYAELNRLKGIMEELRSDKPLLILLDEILKGTNSNDKQAGSMALVKQLIPHPCLAIIATHDLALGDLEREHPLKVKNYCFEANIENDQLFFDYKLKEGLAQKMNASFLMKKMGIIPS